MPPSHAGGMMHMPPHGMVPPMPPPGMPPRGMPPHMPQMPHMPHMPHMPPQMPQMPPQVPPPSGPPPQMPQMPSLPGPGTPTAPPSASALHDNFDPPSSPSSDESNSPMDTGAPSLPKRNSDSDRAKGKENLRKEKAHAAKDAKAGGDKAAAAAKKKSPSKKTKPDKSKVMISKGDQDEVSALLKKILHALSKEMKISKASYKPIFKKAHNHILDEYRAKELRKTTSGKETTTIRKFLKKRQNKIRELVRKYATKMNET